MRIIRWAVLAAAALGFTPGASAALILYTTTLSGANESPPNGSSGTGTVFALYNDVAHTLYLHVEFANLSSPSTAAHIHTPTAVAGTGTTGVATVAPAFPGFPLGATSGVLDNTFDTTSSSFYLPAFLGANGGTGASAEVAFLSGLAAGKAYFNIHTTNVPSGEIRGFLQPTAVPEPATLASAVLGVLAAAGYARFHRRPGGRKTPAPAGPELA